MRPVEPLCVQSPEADDARCGRSHDDYSCAHSNDDHNPRADLNDNDPRTSAWADSCGIDAQRSDGCAAAGVAVRRMHSAAEGDPVLDVPCKRVCVRERRGHGWMRRCELVGRLFVMHVVLRVRRDFGPDTRSDARSHACSDPSSYASSYASSNCGADPSPHASANSCADAGPNTGAHTGTKPEFLVAERSDDVVPVLRV